MAEESKIEEIVTEYLKPVYRLVFRLTGGAPETEDITQEVFVKVWKNLAKYDPKQSLKTWIFTIARNTTIDWFRKKKSIPFSDLKQNWGEEEERDFADNIADLESLPDELFAQAELKEKLDQAVITLSLDQRSVVTLHLEDNLTFEVIAKIMGQPINTVKSHYRRALLKLKEILHQKPY